MGQSEAIGSGGYKCSGPIPGYKQRLLKDCWAQAMTSAPGGGNVMGLSQGIGSTC